MNRITRIKDVGGNIIEDLRDIEEEVVKYFKNILNNWGESYLNTQRVLINNIPKIIKE